MNSDQSAPASVTALPVPRPAEPSEAEREARMGLCCAGEPANLELIRLVRAEGVVDVWGALRSGRLETASGRRARAVDLAAVQRVMDAHQVRFVIPGDDEWPEWLDDLDEVTLPQQRMGGSAFGLWVRGPGQLREWCADSVAMVGSRASTHYGEGVASELAADVVTAGGTVVSGGAYGIDAAAHRGALSMDGRTVAVLANGVDTPYPRGNARLFEAMKSEQLIVSELPPGSHPTRQRFLTRNRLLAALTQGTVIVEAAVRSGARNTVSWADALGRRVMAVPGPVTSAMSVNPHLLIREQQAVLVTCGAHIRELIAPVGQQVLPLERGRARILDGLDEVQRRVFEAVPGRGGHSADELALSCGLDVLTVLDALAELEALELVLENQGRGWKLFPGSVG